MKQENAPQSLQEVENSLAFRVCLAIQKFIDQLWIRMERKEWNQSQLAKEAGFTRQFVGRVLGAGNNCTMETMVRLANAVGSEVEIRLVDRENPKWLKWEQSKESNLDFPEEEKPKPRWNVAMYEPISNSLSAEIRDAQ
jgi:DNA-binding phage protein